MNDIPRELDWVKERATCTIAKMLAQLSQAVDQDIRSINQLRQYPEGSGFEMTLGQDGSAFVVKRAEAIRPFVRFAMDGDSIEVHDDAGRLKLEYRIVMSNEGRCKLTEHGEELEQWQVRKMALEGLFFTA